MTSIRRRRQFEAEVLSAKGQPLTGCFAFVEIETAMRGDRREQRWAGKLTSLTEPSAALDGPHLLRPADQDVRLPIQVYQGLETRMGITSDEYAFLGEGDPPSLP